MGKMRKNEKNEILRNFEEKKFLIRKPTPTRSRCPQVFFLSNQLSANYKFILLHSVCRGIGVQHYIFSLYILII